MKKYIFIGVLIALLESIINLKPFHKVFINSNENYTTATSVKNNSQEKTETKTQEDEDEDAQNSTDRKSN